MPCPPLRHPTFRLRLSGKGLSLTLWAAQDQLRADSLGCAGHPLVRSPHIDALAARGVRFANHYNQATPCGPSRNCLHTGMYMLNHRGVSNGTPLARRFTNWAAELRAQSGGAIRPSLVGYTDAPTDPRGLPLDHVPLPPHTMRPQALS